MVILEYSTGGWYSSHSLVSSHSISIHGNGVGVDEGVHECSAASTVMYARSHWLSDCCITLTTLSQGKNFVFSSESFSSPTCLPWGCHDLGVDFPKRFALEGLIYEFLWKLNNISGRYNLLLCLHTWTYRYNLLLCLHIWTYFDKSVIPPETYSSL